MQAERAERAAREGGANRVICDCRAFAECPTPVRAQMRRYPEFGIRVLMSVRVAAMGAPIASEAQGDERGSTHRRRIQGGPRINHATACPSPRPRCPA